MADIKVKSHQGQKVREKKSEHIEHILSRFLWFLRLKGWLYFSKNVPILAQLVGQTLACCCGNGLQSLRWLESLTS